MSLEPSLRAIFAEALEKNDLAERALYLEQACAGNSDLRRSIEELLEAHDEAGSFLSERRESGANSGRRFGKESLRPEQPGDRIGRFKLLQQIGEGGCGIVYMAEQEEPLRRRVALKVIKVGMDTRSVIARFEAERQALAMMDHPNIAKVFDAGATDTGRPFFVMELVRGVKITEYCDQEKLTTEQRLALFVRVCKAIQHAHQKGIIHRDLKPGNILVTRHDGVSVPKVIDFGIAKATGQERLTDKTVFTAFQQFIGTPAYMSPEQAEMSGLDIDTRSDIYSLGVLLYELLTGKTPFDSRELCSIGLDGMRRIIRENEPALPSTRIATMLDPELITVAGDRQTSPTRLITFVRGDLDWIVMKCLEKDRTRRYGTALEAASDIERHLRNEPVSARPPSKLYQFQKLVRRHRAGSLALASILLAVLIGTGVSTIALFREREARRQSDHRLKTALAFVDEVFTEVAPEIRHLTGAASANEKLAQSGLRFVEQLNDGLGDNPALRPAIVRQLLRLGEYQNPGDGNTIGDYETGLKNARKARALLNKGSFDLHAAAQLELMYSARFAAGSCLIALGRMDEAVAELKAALPLLDQMEALPELARVARRNRARVLNNSGYALVLANRPQRAIDEYLLPTLQSAWARQTSSNWDAAKLDELEVIANLHDALGYAYLFLGRFDQMLALREPVSDLWDYIIQRLPRDGACLSERATSRALHGCALLVTGSTNQGLVLLEQARKVATDLVETDSANDRFRYSQTIVAAIRAIALAHWSHDQTATTIERRSRLQQAERFLAEAEEFGRATKEKFSEIYLQTARTALSKAGAKLTIENRGPL